MQGWLGSKETVLFTGRGPIRCARMSGTLLAWATDSGLRWGAAVPSLPALPSHFSPYRYGHITETSVNPDGSADVQKWYTLGRAAWELS